MISAVIFDMDGVILDTETICLRTWHMLDKEWGLSKREAAPDIDKLFHSVIGTNKNDTMEIIKKAYGQDFDAKAMLTRTSELFHEVEETEGIPLMPYVKECLEYLSSKYRLALASSTRGETVKRQLTEAGLIQYFETLTTGDMVVHSKPAPEIYLMACDSLSLKPEQCVAIEDSPNGIRSAYAAGLKAIMVPDKLLPDAEIKGKLWKLCDSLDDVKSIL